MRVSEWTGDIHVSISAMQLSLPKMSGGGPMVWRTDSVGERERARWSASVSLGLPLCPSRSGGGRLSAGGASERGSSSVSFPFGGRRTDDGTARGGLGGDDDAVARVACLSLALSPPLRERGSDPGRGRQRATHMQPNQRLLARPNHGVEK